MINKVTKKKKIIIFDAKKRFFFHKLKFKKLN